jgi:hypothetical protein
VRVQGGFSMRRFNVCVFFCSPHHATHTLDVQWYGRMALAFRWLVRRLDVGQRMAKWMVD